MQIKKYSLIFTFLILLSITLTNKVEAQTDILSKKDATIEAHIFLENGDYSEEWKNGDVVFENFIYDIDDTLLGYHFKIYNDERYLGYVVISASKSLDPVFSFGTGSFISENIEGKDKGKKLYFINPTVIVTANNAKEIQETFNKKKTELINTILSNLNKTNSEIESAEEELEIIENFKLKTVIEREKEADKSESINDNNSITPSAISIAAYSNPLTVRRMSQRTSGVKLPNQSCGPTVGAMMANYYSSRGYESINNSSYYGGDAAFINHLAGTSFMKTGTIGTALADFENGLRKHLNLNLTSNLFEVARTTATNQFSNYKTLINNGHPVAIRFTNIITAIFGSTAYSWHYVLGVGYSGDYVYFLDPDGSNAGTKSFKYTQYQSDMNLIWIIP